MAITFPTVFQSTVATDPAATAAGYLTPTRYNQGCAPAGLTANALLYSTDATTLAQDGTNLAYTTASGPRLKIGSSGTSAGWVGGYSGIATGYAALWNSAVTPSGTNYGVLHGAGGDIYINGSQGSAVAIRIDHSATIASFTSTSVRMNQKLYPSTDGSAGQTATGIFGNTGAPNNANGSDGDFYFRADGGSLTTIYQRRSGSWVGVV